MLLQVCRYNLVTTTKQGLRVADMFEYSELDTLSEDSYKDSTLIMQLLRDNLVYHSHLYVPFQRDHN